MMWQASNQIGRCALPKDVEKPPDPFPEWQQRLGAMAALTQRGYEPKAIAAAMCDAGLQ
jgi:hypothetical protein